MIEHRTYTKINTLYKREEKNGGNIILGAYSRPEFELLLNCPWRWFLKIDGTNTGIYWDGELRIDGKSERAQWNPKVKKFLDETITTETMQKAFPADPVTGEFPNVIIYGETFGSGIQGVGGKYFNGEAWGFRVFDVNINGFWLEPEDVIDVAHKLGLETPTDFGVMTIAEAEEMVKNGFKDTVAEKDLDAEGLVGRPIVQLFNKKGERVMVKIKTCDYKKLANK